jgi:hypothetical protein
MKKDKFKQYAPYIIGYGIMIILYFILHMGIRTLSRDDIFFSNQLNNESLISFLSYRYIKWTSRIGIEAILVLVTRLPIMVWRILDILMIVILTFAAGIIINKTGERKYSLLAIPVIMMIPTEVMHSAGEMATTINYLWPAALGIYAASFLFRNIRGIKVKAYEYIFIYLSLIFALFNEQITVIYFVATGLFILVDVIKSIKDKAKPSLSVHWYIFFILSLLGIMLVVTCPGNANRTAIEAGLNFPGWENVTLIEKFGMGFLQAVTFPMLSTETNFLFFFTTLSILYINITKKKKYIYIIASLFPMVLPTLSLIEKILSMAHINITFGVTYFMSNVDLPSMSDVPMIHVIIEVLIYLFYITCTIVGIVGVFSKGKEENVVITTQNTCPLYTQRIIAILLLCAAFCSRMLTGFSPTVYVSFHRTAIIECILIALLNGYLLCFYNADEDEKNKKQKRIINIIALILGLVTVLKPLI